MAEPTEDEIDDLLYFARTNETQDLRALAQRLSAKYGAPPHTIFQSADPTSGNTALHLASANGHLGTSPAPGPPPRAAANRAPQRPGRPSSPRRRRRRRAAAAADEPGRPRRRRRRGGGAAGQRAQPRRAARRCTGPRSTGTGGRGVRLLLRRGADAAARNAAGRDALFEAEKGGRDGAVAALLAEGARGRRAGSTPGRGRRTGGTARGWRKMRREGGVGSSVGTRLARHRRSRRRGKESIPKT